MKQKFTKEDFEKFKKYFSIKAKGSNVENYFLEKTYKYIKFIKWLPGIEMIGVGNSISMNASNLESDIDLYIVSKPKTMWINRIIITLIFQILGVRKNAKKHAGRFCLSFFSTTLGMDFSNWKIENDIYLYFWILYFKPLLSYNNTYEAFLEKNSNWLDFSEYNDIIIENKKYIRYKKNTKENTFFLRIYEKVDYLIKIIFLPKTLKHFEKLGKPYGIIINDDLLKFHDNDIREKIKKEIMD
ncbi:MAG: hypothetical protein PHH98_00360 [Candidatus Gracilibacteria bacterium]|nr:hypothetical protein [Candidatus Gracilibacteria bacterium]